jgi:ribosome biogenesis GTPase
MPIEGGAAEPAGWAGATAGSRGSPVEGLVVAVAHGFVELHTEQGPLLCTARGRLLRPPAPPVAVAGGRRGHPDARRQPSRPERARAAAPVRIVPGDRVRALPLGNGEGVVEELLPRRSAFARAAGDSGAAQVLLANLDHAALVFAVREPPPHFGMLDRYLALCEHAGVHVTICLNKVDLGAPCAVDDAIALYRDLGYTLQRTSAVTGEGLAALAERLRGRVSLLTGPSGVGKSSLINALLPGARLRIGAVSEATGKGRHTTTGVRLLPLEAGGWLADSAGIRELALWGVAPEDLPRCFVELRPLAGSCRYDDCTHGEDEEGCALRAALADGRITPARFASFERLLDEARSAAG